LAKITYTGGRKPKGLNKIEKLAKVTLSILLIPAGILSQVLVTLANLSILLRAFGFHPPA
jgi:hypothetical protein